MKLFVEERELQEKLKAEWYEAMKAFVHQVQATFERKAEERDDQSLVWERIEFPQGFATLLFQKIMRLKPLLTRCNPETHENVNWPKVLEELGDIAAYCQIFGSLILMLNRREGILQKVIKGKEGQS
jgi:hypothetical protein